MDFYAFNVTPIAGWETQYGSGIDAALSLAETGTTANTQLGSAATALSLTTSADALLAQIGNGALALAIAGSAGPQLGILANGQASLALSVSGAYSSVAQGYGLAPMSMTCSYGIPFPPVATLHTAAKEGWLVPKRYPAFIVPADTVLRVDRTQRLPAVGPERKL
jgi:hypothetical protein